MEQTRSCGRQSVRKLVEVSETSRQGGGMPPQAQARAATVFPAAARSAGSEGLLGVRRMFCGAVAEPVKPDTPYDAQVRVVPTAEAARLWETTPYRDPFVGGVPKPPVLSEVTFPGSAQPRWVSGYYPGAKRYAVEV